MAISTINICMGGILFVFFFYVCIVSILENEKRAASRALLLALILPLPFLFVGLYNFPFQEQAGLILIVLTVLALIIVFFPGFNLKSIKEEIPSSRIDERDSMFSRRILKEDTERFHEYYSRRPDHKEKDDIFRSKPGLLSKNTVYFNPVQFAAAEASFYTVESFMVSVDGPLTDKKRDFDPEKISKFIKEWSIKLGACHVGITDLHDYHFYTVGGRDFNYGESISRNHKFAIAFTVEMDYDTMRSAPAGPTVMESAQQYLDSGSIAIQVASFIRNLGHSARAHIDGHYHVVCPLVARDAGLGEIGRMGLLMTPELGPRVRISVVTTDLPLITYEYKVDAAVIDFCKKCKKCAYVCPSHAISFDDRKMINGVKRWQIDSEECFTYWCIAGTDCGRCMIVCPYSHPNNPFHNFIRFGIKHFPVFRKLAIHMDDFFYGKRPPPRDIPEWMDIKETEGV